MAADKDKRIQRGQLAADKNMHIQQGQHGRRQRHAHTMLLLMLPLCTNVCHVRLTSSHRPPLHLPNHTSHQDGDAVMGTLTSYDDMSILSREGLEGGDRGMAGSKLLG